jgi:hypothetical protein
MPGLAWPENRAGWRGQPLSGPAAAHQQCTTPDPSQREHASVPTPWHDGHLTDSASAPGAIFTIASLFSFATFPFPLHLWHSSMPLPLHLGHAAMIVSFVCVRLHNV